MLENSRSKDLRDERKDQWGAVICIALSTMLNGCNDTRRKNVDSPPAAPLSTEVEFCNKLWSSNTKRLTCSDPQITNLSTLSRLPHLEVLDLESTSASDLGPLRTLRKLRVLKLGYDAGTLHPLGGLINLEQLEAVGQSRDSDIRDLSVLGQLKKLRSLNLSHTTIKNLETLSKLRNLEELILSLTNLADLSPLSSLRDLQELYVNETAVRDLSPLKKLTRLRNLNVAQTNISDISALSQLKNLEQLDLSGTSLSDISPLGRLPKLQRLVFQNQPVDLDDPIALMITTLKPLKQLTLLDVSYSGFTKAQTERLKRELSPTVVQFE